MLSGDTEPAARQVAALLGIDEVYAGLLPEEKVERLEALARERKNAKGKIAFVGDGINDAPALVRADVGIAMGALGSDASVEAADVVIMDDMPSKVARAVAVAERTRAIVWQNIAIALGVKAVFIVLGAWGAASLGKRSLRTSASRWSRWPMRRGRSHESLRQERIEAGLSGRKGGGIIQA